MLPEPAEGGGSDPDRWRVPAAGFTPQIAQESSETATTLALVAAQLGVSIVPGSYRGIRRAGGSLHAAAAGE